MRRRNRAGLKRMGVLALALVIALGTLGIAHAAWTEDLYIDSTVQLGTLDIDVAGVSSTFVYKVPPGTTDRYFVNGTEVFIYPNGTEVHYVYGQTDPYPPSGGTLVAWAVTEPDMASDADIAYMTFSGLFPGVDFWADVELEYLGSIPAKIRTAQIYADNPSDESLLTSLWQRGLETKEDPDRYGAWIDGELSIDNGLNWVNIDPINTELHQFDLVHVTLHVRLPEGEEFPNISNLAFTGIISIIQWNEYEEP